MTGGRHTRVIAPRYVDQGYFCWNMSNSKNKGVAVDSSVDRKILIENGVPFSSMPVSSLPISSLPVSCPPVSALHASEGRAPDYELIELMYFAYRDLVAEPDRVLENFGLGRAHHRVLHFVTRRRGLTIAELLDTLKITKQSLNRVLKDLLDQNYVVARPGESDRRQRQLFPTLRGEALALDMAHVQSRRFARTFAQLPLTARTAARDFLRAVIETGEPENVAAFVGPEHSRQVCE
jgi:DNA-binding MarR family transcriptional regulator